MKSSKRLSTPILLLVLFTAMNHLIVGQQVDPSKSAPVIPQLMRKFTQDRTKKTLAKVSTRRQEGPKLRTSLADAVTALRAGKTPENSQTAGPPERRSHGWDTRFDSREKSECGNDSTLTTAGHHTLLVRQLHVSGSCLHVQNGGNGSEVRFEDNCGTDCDHSSSICVSGRTGIRRRVPI